MIWGRSLAQVADAVIEADYLILWAETVTGPPPTELRLSGGFKG